MKRFLLVLGLTLPAWGLVVPTAAAAETTKPIRAEKTLLERVAKRLLDVCDPVPSFEWPPSIDFEDDGINAYATVYRKDGKSLPLIRVTADMMRKVIQGDPDRLAFLLGHEIGHLVRKHVVPKELRDTTAFLKNIFTSTEEGEADLFGAELMVKAGFSFQKGKRVILRMKELGLDYSSFEGLGKNHPSWNDRLKNIDKGQAKLWKSMSAFQNGVVFLTTEQYRPAEVCFEQVTRDFPQCYEAWVNLGFACLMQYCDKLDEADLRAYDLGQLLIGGFYRRATIKDTDRGRDKELWWKAVGALQEALRINPDLTLAKANLGLAYLVHYDGKDVVKATRYLQEAADAAVKDKTLDPIAHAALLVNLGVANLGAGKGDVALKQFEEGEKLGRALVADGPRGREENASLTAALLYNRARHLASRKDADSQAKALELYTQYLKTASPLSLWWPLAYDRYKDLCKAQGKTAVAADDFKKKRPAPLRLVVGVKLNSGKEVTLGQDLEDVVKLLGKGQERVVTPGTNLKRLRYEKEGVELLVTDVVLAVCLTSPDSPAVSLRGKMVGSDKTAELTVGMTTKQVEEVLGDDYLPCELTTIDTFYRYYREQGLAIRLVKGKVVEVVIVQLPKS